MDSARAAECDHLGRSTRICAARGADGRPRGPDESGRYRHAVRVRLYLATTNDTVVNAVYLRVVLGLCGLPVCYEAAGIDYTPGNRKCRHVRLKSGRSGEGLGWSGVLG